jgi:hypothetical protein
LFGLRVPKLGVSLIPFFMMTPSSKKETLGDLQKLSEVYGVHEGAIVFIQEMLQDRNNQIRRAIEQSQARDRRITNLPTLSCIDNPAHINCDGLQILFPRVGMEAFRRDQNTREAAELREPLRHIASVRISVMQYETNRRAVNYVREIEEIDKDIAELAPDAEVPALTPFLFKPQTAISQLKKLAGMRKFENPHILMNFGVLYAGDSHILHAVCMSMLQNGMASSVLDVIKSRAIEVFPQIGDERALQPYFQTVGIDMFCAYIIALVESGQMKDAISWCRGALWADKVRKSEKLSEKYAAALRHQGLFDEAISFLKAARDVHNLRSSDLNTQYNMALSKNRNVLPG